MHPELFTVHVAMFSWTIMAYSFFYVVATLVAVVGTYTFALHRGFHKKHLIIFLVIVVGGGFVSARLWHIFTNWHVYASRQMDMFALHMENFAIVGGLIGAISIGYVVSKILRIDFWKLGDLSVVFLSVGIAIARVGCFLNGCCFGYVTHMPWGVRFPLLSSAHTYQIAHGEGSIFSVRPVHPTQLYELAAALIGGCIAWFCMKKKYPPGVAIAAFGMWFAFFRLINMHFRVFPDSLYVPWGFYSLIYVVVIVLCSVIIFHKVFVKKNKNMVK